MDWQRSVSVAVDGGGGLGVKTPEQGGHVRAHLFKTNMTSEQFSAS